MKTLLNLKIRNKNNLIAGLVAAVALSASDLTPGSLRAFAADAPVPLKPVLKTIELEWEAVEKASGYEVRLTPAAGGKPLKFLTEEAKIVQAVPVGNYKLQIRSRSEDADIFSPWSETLPIEVVAKEITPLKPEDNSIIAALDANKFTVEFEWKPVDGVKEYTIKVWNEKRKENPWVFVTKYPRKKLDVPPGEIYFWQVLFESASGISYAQSPTTFKFTILGSKLTAPEIGPLTLSPEIQVLEWSKTLGANKYQAKLYYRHIDETEYKKVEETETSDRTWTFHKLKRGSYKLEVSASAPRRTSSDTSTIEFMLKPTATEIQQAELKISARASQLKR